jgi:uncharacterized RDD family membrane protein YckC
MAAIDWSHYQVTCSPGPVPAPAPAVPVAAPAPLASRGARLGAYLIDLVLTGVLCACWIYILQVSESQGDYLTSVQRLFVLGVLGLVAVQLSLLTWHGQSIGKRLMGVRIVRFADGGNPGFFRVVVLRLCVPALIAGIPLLGRVFYVADILNIYGEERRCLHDYLAGTKVVEA